MNSLRAIASGVTRRVGWGLADQVLSSLTNFALGLVAARSLAPQGFGAFSLAFSVYTLTIGASRAVNGQPLMVRFSDQPDKWRRATASATGTALVIGTVAGIACLISGQLLAGALSEALVRIGFLMPVLALQDCWRWAFFAGGKGRSAFVNDLVWAATLFPLYGLLVMRSDATIGALTLVWCSTAGIAALVGILQVRILPRPQDSRAWLRAHRDLGPRYFGEFLATGGSVQLGVFVVAGIGGLGLVASIRAAQVLFGPYNVLVLGLGLVRIPEAVRALKISKAHLRKMAAGLSTGLVVAALLMGGLLLILPDASMRFLLGRMAQGATGVLIPVAFMRASTGAIQGAVTAMRALQATKASFWVRIITSPWSIVGGGVGAMTGSAAAAAWGLTIGNAAAAAVWWIACKRALDSYSGAPGNEGQTPPLVHEAG